MAISLTQTPYGNVNWASTFNANLASIQDYLNNRRLPTGYVQGLKTTWTGNTTLTVGAGSCRDSTDVIDMSLSSAANVTLTSNGVNGLDTKTAAGTVTMALS